MRQSAGNDIYRKLQVARFLGDDRAGEFTAQRCDVLSRHLAAHPEADVMLLKQLEAYCATDAASPSAGNLSFFFILELATGGGRISIDAMEDDARLMPLADFPIGQQTLFFCPHLEVPASFVQDPAAAAEPPSASVTSYQLDIAIGSITGEQELLVGVLELTGRPQPDSHHAGLPARRMDEATFFADPRGVVTDILDWAREL